MIACSERYHKKLDLVESLMTERQQICSSLSKHQYRLNVVEENIRALNAELHTLEKQLILKHYTT